MHRFVQHSGRLYTSTIALAELYVWAFGRPDPAPALASIEKMLFHEVSVVEYDNDCGKEFGRVRVEMRRQGLEVPSLDLLIASVALVYDLTQVRDFCGRFGNFWPGTDRKSKADGPASDDWRCSEDLLR